VAAPGISNLLLTLLDQLLDTTQILRAQAVILASSMLGSTQNFASPSAD
jgi:hypothetical protein